ncbi:hypothetical protein Y032_0067g38 [Ancylostoma ceylanicum]|uniref:Uncharacterized protein n=1 Tax=Ancylostoma ceylanicum TaxID=53326 RepID=A0A016TZH8_9BILA|nr:hypothetical protein Y032_0067g38 [Ancylostoma ceylanicum]
MELHLVVLATILGITHVIGKNTVCENEIPGFDDDMRISIWNKHNDYRSALARGEVKMKNGSARQASKMRELERYNCSAEKSAYESARQLCESKTSPPGEYDQNVHVLDGSSDVMKVTNYCIF